MKKVTSNNLTAGMLNKNFKSTVKRFIALDKNYSFVNAIKGTSAYWKNIYIKLGIPTFFMTLSGADLR